MNKKLIHTALAAGLWGVAAMAQAGIVNLTGWTFGSGHTITVADPGHHGLAGGFKGSLSGFGAPFDSASFETYCVELTQSFYGFPSGDMPNYSIFTPGAYGKWGSNSAAADIANRIGQLMTYVNANQGSVDDSVRSTGLQLAIWNSIYDTDNTLTSHSGALFSETGGDSSFRDAANALLTASASTVSNLNVFIVANDSSQDFLVTTHVPEPGTLALAAAGFAGLGFSARRRRANAAA